MDALRCLTVMPSPPPAPRPESHRLLAWLGVTTAAGLLVGLSLIPSADGVRASDPGTLHLYGEPLPAGPDAVDVAVGRMQRKFEGWFNLELPDRERRPTTYGSLGVQPDRQRLGQLIRDMSTSEFDRGRGSTDRSAIELIVPLRVDRQRLLETLLVLKDELDRAAVDARLDLDREAVIGERAGRLLDVDRSVLAIERALERGADGAPLWFEQQSPRRAASELGSVRYHALLGFFETRYEPAVRAKERTFNLQRAAAKLDGYVLMPGDELDFNAVIGPRDEANGYLAGAWIADGELVDGVGGSTCQISGTLHAAALLAGLDIVERHPLARASPYLALGLEAAVAYPAVNLRLSNPYDFPVVLRETVEDGRVRAEIRGARRPYTITLILELDGATPFEEIERPDDRLERGQRVLAQRGVPGLDLRRYRIRRDGAHAIREATHDRYAPTAQLVLVGTATPSAALETRASTTGRPPHDPAPEYLADELLVLTQSEQLDGPLVEQRVPGRFAMPGWTKNVGAPAWNSKP